MSSTISNIAAGQLQNVTFLFKIQHFPGHSHYTVFAVKHNSVVFEVLHARNLLKKFKYTQIFNIFGNSPHCMNTTINYVFTILFITTFAYSGYLTLCQKNHIRPSPDSFDDLTFKVKIT